MGSDKNHTSLAILAAGMKPSYLAILVADRVPSSYINGYRITEMQEVQERPFRALSLFFSDPTKML